MRQLKTYDLRRVFASRTNNKRYEQAMWNHIYKLEYKLQERCPQLHAERKGQQGLVKFNREVQAMMKQAMEATISFFTAGWL